MTAPSSEQLRTAVEVAVHAPSIHNTQPWRWAIRPGGIDLYADRSRMLRVADPDGRALHLSCGAALHHALLALRADGWHSDVLLLPDDDDPDFLAAVRVTERVEPRSEDSELLYAVLWRTSERRPFVSSPIPSRVADRLYEAAAAEGAILRLVVAGPLAERVATLVTGADEAQRGDAAYVAELASWIRSDPTAADGIPLRAVPHLDAERRTDVPVRDLEVAGEGGLPVHQEEVEHPALAVLCSRSEGPSGWLHAGSALSAVLLRATVEGVSASPLSQALEVPSARGALRHALDTTGFPQAMLRLGYLPPEATPLPLTPRRDVADVLLPTEDQR